MSSAGPPATRRSTVLIAGDELAGAEGLGDVVVGAHGEPDERVDLLGARGEQDHGQLGGRAEPAQHLDPVGARHHHVEHHEIRTPVAGRRPAPRRRRALRTPRSPRSRGSPARSHGSGPRRRRGGCASPRSQGTTTRARPSPPSRTLHGGPARTFTPLCCLRQRRRAPRDSGTHDAEELLMNRKTAVAAASAISISLVAATVARRSESGSVGVRVVLARTDAADLQRSSPRIRRRRTRDHAGYARTRRTTTRANTKDTVLMTDHERRPGRAHPPPPGTPSGFPSRATGELAAASPVRARPAEPDRRRRHPAAASRWLLGGLSVASFFAIAGTVANASANSVATPASTNASTTRVATRMLDRRRRPRRRRARRHSPRPIAHTTSSGS